MSRSMPKTTMRTASEAPAVAAQVPRCQVHEPYPCSCSRLPPNSCQSRSGSLGCSGCSGCSGCCSSLSARLLNVPSSRLAFSCRLAAFVTFDCRKRSGKVNVAHTDAHTHTHMHTSVGKCTLITPWQREKAMAKSGKKNPFCSLLESPSSCALAIKLFICLSFAFCCAAFVFFSFCFSYFAFHRSRSHSGSLSLCLSHSFWRMIIEKQPAAASKNYWPLFACTRGKVQWSCKVAERGGWLAGFAERAAGRSRHAGWRAGVLAGCVDVWSRRITKVSQPS